MPIKPALIDTSVWLFALRKDFIPEIRSRVDDLLRNNLVFTTGIINLELLSGAKTDSEFERLKDRLMTLDDIITDDIIWDKASVLAFKLRRKGITVPHTDILIAACAILEGCVLLHADNHFNIIAQHTDLIVESYVNIVRQ
jgi:predicted nucleic acid-binding protein